MKAELEAILEARIRGGRLAYDAIGSMYAEGLISNPKQGLRTLEKWTRQGKWEWGSSIESGWFK